MLRYALLVTTAVTLGAAPLGAQSFQGRDRTADRVPPAYMPPPGMCRIWIDGVPPGQQPAPTDCASAVRNRPPNGRVIFGDDVRRKKFKGKSAAWGLSDGRRDSRASRDRRPDYRDEGDRDDGDRGASKVQVRDERADARGSKVRVRDDRRTVGVDGKRRRAPR